MHNDCNCHGAAPALSRVVGQPRLLFGGISGHSSVPSGSGVPDSNEFSADSPSLDMQSYILHWGSDIPSQWPGEGQMVAAALAVGEFAAEWIYLWGLTLSLSSATGQVDAFASPLLKNGGDGLHVCCVPVRVGRCVGGVVVRVVSKWRAAGGLTHQFQQTAKRSVGWVEPITPLH